MFGGLGGLGNGAGFGGLGGLSGPEGRLGPSSFAQMQGQVSLISCLDIEIHYCNLC